MPTDKELADAAQKFIARAKQLVTETEALAKAAAEKAATVAPTADAWNKAKPPVEAARQKAVPLTAAMKEAEKKMLASREKAENDAESLAALERRLETARKVARLPDLKKAIVTATDAVPGREAAFAAAQKALDEIAPTLAALDAKSKTAGEAAATASKTLEAARAEHALHAEIADAIAAALKSTQAAQQKAPANAGLNDAAAKLQESFNAAQTDAAASQKKVDAAAAVHKPASDAFVAAQEALAGALAERGRREKAVEAAKTGLAAAKATVAAKQAQLTTTKSDLNDRWSNDFTLAELKPLTPEQLCWSVFRVTGVYDRFWKAEAAELDKAKPLTAEQKKDPKQVEARDVELEQRTYDKLKGNIGTFVAYYGAVAGQPQGDFFATADQALFVANGAAINSWAASAGGNVTERIAKQKDLQAAAEDLYLTVFTRMPTEGERTDVINYFKDRTKDKAVAAQELVWALLNSAEFRFNH